MGEAPVEGLALAGARLTAALGVGTAVEFAGSVALALGDAEAAAIAVNAGPALFAGVVPMAMAFVRTGTGDMQPAAINMRGTMPKRRMLVTPIGQTVLRHCTRA